ncbi:MAG: ABC transporter permease subunit [Planctomycetota bacterium]
MPAAKSNNSIRPEDFGTTSWPRRFAERAARWIVTAGGLAIILSILGILLFITVEVWPLFQSATVVSGAPIALPGRTAAIAIDEYKSKILGLGFDGNIRIAELSNPGASTLLEIPGYTPAPIRLAETMSSGKAISALTASGAMLAFPIRFDISFKESSRVVTPAVRKPVTAEVKLDNPTDIYSVEMDDDGRAVFANVESGGKLVIVKRLITTNAMTDEKAEEWTSERADAPAGITTLIIDRELRNIYAGTKNGELAWWSLKEGEPSKLNITKASNVPLSKIAFLLGDQAVVAGYENGALEIWFPFVAEGIVKKLDLIRSFPSHPGPIATIAAAKRNKGFIAQDASGKLGLYYSTSARVMWTGASPIRDARSLFYFPKGDGIAVANETSVATFMVDNPHPEFSIGAVFGKVWYEGRPEPEFTWQSTGGTDDNESKFSLTPLLYGTLKGTFYSLLLAIPIAILAAMYTSQFLHPTLRSYLKPAVEVMAALPSVVLGFLAGLWLAPRVAEYFTGIMLMIAIVPLSVIAAGRISLLFPREWRGKFLPGTEVLAFVIVIAAAVSLCLWISEPVEQLLFGGNFQLFLFENTGLKYDQNNCIVVGIAMGFAVIPIIYSIAEDAFSNVPRNLVSASLALGASRWDTVVRVVLPTASPGIFSAIMVGFGRAVGETMIVLMAAGNTPIMSSNPFNGFRTLSANVATEIPEAAEHSTHYRTLFLAALLLFVVTFAVNTVAEIVRQRLRKKYASL